MIKAYLIFLINFNCILYLNLFNEDLLNALVSNLIIINSNNLIKFIKITKIISNLKSDLKNSFNALEIHLYISSNSIISLAILELSSITIIIIKNS